MINIVISGYKKYNTNIMIYDKEIYNFLINKR